MSSSSSQTSSLNIPNIDWKTSTKNLINKYEGNNNFQIYQDKADSLKANPKKYLTAPRGVLLTPEMQSYARSLGYKGDFSHGQPMPKIIADSLQDKYLNNMFSSLDKIKGFPTIADNIKPQLAQLHYNANNLGIWPKLTNAVAENNYDNIANELEDSQAYIAEQERINKNKGKAVARWRDSVNYIRQNKPGSTYKAPISKTNVTTPVNKQINSNGIYVVNKGDTIDAISKRHGINSNELMRINNITDPKKLQIGANLKLPPKFVKKSSYNKLASELKDKYATMIKHVPMISDNIVVNKKDDVEKPTKSLNKTNLDMICKRLYSKVIKPTEETDSQNKQASEVIKQIKNIDDVLEAIYNENKTYFPHGLTSDLYNGKHDDLILLKVENKPIGFIGKQIRNNDAYYSVGILPEYRGKGYAKNTLINLINKNKDTVDDNYWTAHKDNKGSIALFNSLKKQGLPLNLKLFS